MRLAHKLSLVQFVLIAAVLLAHALVQMRREVQLFESDMQRDQHVTAALLQAAVTDVWQLYGPQRAMQLIASANSSEKTVHIAWVPGDAGAAAPGAASASGPAPEQTIRVERAGRRPGTLSTYAPITINGVPHGSVRVSESLAEERRFLHTTILHVIATAAAIGLGALVLSAAFGTSFIVKPMGLLVAQARRIGAGDLSGRLRPRRDDEIGELAREMNQMCERLQQAADRIAEESRARLAAEEQLRHADRLATVGTLSSGIAHELGTPLNVVSGRAKMIETDALRPDEVQSSARIIREQAERMARIIRQMLDFSRHGAQKKTPGDLREVTRQVRAFLLPLARARSVEIALAEDAPEPLVRMDPEQIKQVVSNLCLNGIQAMKSGGTLTLGLCRVRASRLSGPLRTEAEYVLLEVRDTGCGIPPESLPRIFDPFYTTKETGEGTGLGLSITRGIVQEHGGWIEVESELNRGSSFKVYLPAVEVACAETS